MAYCNIDEELIEETTAWLKDEQGIMVDDGPTFGQIADYCIKKDKKIWYDDSENIEHDFLMEASKNEYGNWKVVSVLQRKGSSNNLPGTMGRNKNRFGASHTGIVWTTSFIDTSIKSMLSFGERTGMELDKRKTTGKKNGLRKEKERILQNLRMVEENEG